MRPDLRLLQFLIPLLIILPIFYFRMRRALKPRRLKPKMLLFTPLFIIGAAILLMASAPPPPDAFVWLGLSGLIGAAIGWYWGTLTLLHLHPEDGTLMSTNSQAAIGVVIALVLFRYGLRAGLGAEASVLHLELGTITDIFVIFSASLISARSLEIYLRAQKLLQPPS